MSVSVAVQMCAAGCGGPARARRCLYCRPCGDARAAASKLRGQRVRRRFLDTLLERDQGICQICQQQIPEDPANQWEMATADHIVPISRGGEDSLANLRLTHMICNVRRGAR